jgi:hypothetical protein
MVEERPKEWWKERLKERLNYAGIGAVHSLAFPAYKVMSAIPAGPCDKRHLGVAVICQFGAAQVFQKIE